VQSALIAGRFATAYVTPARETVVVHWSSQLHDEGTNEQIPRESRKCDSFSMHLHATTRKRAKRAVTEGMFPML